MLIIGCGGNTTTGPLAKRFIGPKRHPHIVALYKFDTPRESEEFGRIRENSYDLEELV